MAQEEVELVRRMLETWNDGDLDAVMAAYTPDATLVTDPRFPEGGTFEGRDAIRRFYEGLLVGWEGGRSFADVKTVEEIEDAVFASFNWRGTGEQSGIEVEFETHGVFHFRGDEVERLQLFFDRDAALAAAGSLSPPSSDKGDDDAET